MHLVFLAEIVLISVIEHRRPIVVVGGNGLPQGNCNLLKSKAIRKLLCHILISLVVYRSLGHIGIRCLDTKYICCILLIGNAHIYILAEFAHDLSCLFLAPELIAVIQVTGNLHAKLLSRLAGIQTDCCNRVVERRSDAGKVEPVCPLQNLVPVKIVLVCCIDGRTCAVIDHLGWSLGGTFLQIIDSHTVSPADDITGVNAVPSQGIDSRLSDLVLWQLCDKACVKPIVGKRHCHVGLSASKRSAKLVRLYKTIISFRC